MPNIILENDSRRREIPCAAGASLFEALAETDWLPRADCGGRGVCGRCRVRVSPPEALPPTAQERARLPAAALAEGVRLACLARPEADLRMVIEPPEAGAAPWPEIADLPSVPWPPAASGEGLGVAVDLGSTNIRISLLDLGSGRRLAARRGHNPQLRYGTDVLTRLVRAAAGQTAAAIARDSRAAIGEGLALLFGRDLAGPAGGEAVTRLGIVGNTAVLALLTGQGGAELMEPDNWGRQITCADGDFGGWRRGWGLGGAAEVRVWESLSGFVGSDLLAGVAGCGLLAGPAPALLVDFGTNTEIALWDGAALWVAAAAGGPAFEGSGISCGLPAEAGAVHRVAWAE
ncbi:MAG: ASKHA domain-containing protein, partial [Rhodospirillaceae bacterium]